MEISILKLPISILQLLRVFPRWFTRLNQKVNMKHKTWRLAGYDGDLIIEIDTVEIIRASDLASIEQEATIDIDFDYQIWFWTYTIHVAELVVTNEYDPALEGYDFPISVGEYWETSYSQDTTYSGSSDYVDIPSDTSTSNTTSWEEILMRKFPALPTADVLNLTI